MTRILKVTSSLHAGAGQSSLLATQFIDALLARDPGAQVDARDLTSEPVPHLTAERFAAFTTPLAERSAGQQAVVTYSDALIEEIRKADVLVLGVPMYNFGIPSQLKAWFDHIARAGVTFQYTATGSVGLLTGKKAVVFATRGGTYAGTPRDTQSPYLRDFLAFLGITDVEFVYAEGLAMGPEPREAGLARARSALQNLAAPLRLAA
ncbi:MAG TPA: NAD(P)H-dependent oxidoreductase [Verrucomicrobiae bacterium]|nr:NAD(P)H-dependent oxidoreductase [Verrucomicrobiae bacterium]